MTIWRKLKKMVNNLPGEGDPGPSDWWQSGDSSLLLYWVVLIGIYLSIYLYSRQANFLLYVTMLHHPPSPRQCHSLFPSPTHQPGEAVELNQTGIQSVKLLFNFSTKLREKNGQFGPGSVGRSQLMFCPYHTIPTILPLTIKNLCI